MYIRKLFDYSVPLVAAATILVMGALVIAVIVSYTAYNIKHAEDNITVTGSAKKAVTADTARLVLNLDTKTGNNDQQSGYARLDMATKKITQYLTDQGFTDYEAVSITSNQNYTYPQYGEPIMTGFTVNRQIIVRSNDIDKINILANNIEPFSGSGYNVSTQSLELTYGNLDETRVELLSEAIKDAKDRADAIAKESSRSVGTLRSASSGVVQVLPAGGVDISDYGTYDTQSVNKEVMVTVRATFEL